MSSIFRACCLAAMLAGTAAALPADALATALTISDGTFSAWRFGSYLQGTGTGGSASMSVDSTLGNPAPGLAVTTDSPVGVDATGYGYDTAAPTSDVLNKASYVMTVQFQSNADAYGIGQGIQLIVVQNGIVYISHGYKNTGTERNGWKTVTLKGKLVGTSFNNISGTGPSAPDFTSGIPTEFGFSGQDYQSGRTLSVYYDNYNLAITLK